MGANSGCRTCRKADSLQMGLLLAATGGFLDAYTYVARGRVFANAQTGNLVLLGLRAFEADPQALRYLVPVCAFVLGILLAEFLRARKRVLRPVNWRQAVLVVEALVLVASAFLPESWNNLVNASISFVCAMQVNAFRAFEGNRYATTMCTGNLRSGTEHLWRYAQERDGHHLRVGLQYFAVIGCFMLGAGLGGLLTQILQLRAALIPAGLLLVAALGMCREEEEG